MVIVLEDGVTVRVGVRDAVGVKVFVGTVVGVRVLVAVGAMRVFVEVAV